MDPRIKQIDIIRAVKTNNFEKFVFLFNNCDKDAVSIDKILFNSMRFKDLEAFKYVLDSLKCIPCRCLYNISKCYSIDFVNAILDYLDRNSEYKNVDKVYSILLSRFIYNNIKEQEIFNRILENPRLDFENNIININYRICFISESLCHTFKINNLVTVIKFMIPYYNRYNIPLEELLYTILHTYRHLKRVFCVKNFVDFKGRLDLNYKMELIKDSYRFNYCEDIDMDSENMNIEDMNIEDMNEYSESEIMPPTINTIKLGSLLLFFNIDLKYFIKKDLEFIEDTADMEKINEFKEYY